jgi:molybdopterin-guanine dinucleotide biosynthesis protein A
VDAAILAGGRARRLGGQDKRALRIGPTTILERQLATLAGLVDRVFVVGGDPIAGVGPRPAVLPDRLPNAGALGGLYTALCEAAGSHVLIVACDLPFVTTALLARLISLADSECDAVVPRSTDGLQPLCAVYARRLAGEVRSRIESGRLKIQDLFGTIRIREFGPAEIAAFEAAGRLFFNVNTPNDLEEAVRLSSHGQRPAGR